MCGDHLAQELSDLTCLEDISFRVAKMYSGKATLKKDPFIRCLNSTLGGESTLLNTMAVLAKISGHPYLYRPM